MINGKKPDINFAILAEMEMNLERDRFQRLHKSVMPKLSSDLYKKLDIGKIVAFGTKGPEVNDLWEKTFKGENNMREATEQEQQEWHDRQNRKAFYNEVIPGLFQCHVCGCMYRKKEDLLTCLH